MSEEQKIDHRARKRIKEVKKKARPGNLLFSNLLFLLFQLLIY